MNKNLLNSKTFRSNSITYGLVIVAFIVVQLLINTGHITNAFQGLLVPICFYIVMAISLNLVVGISGELSLGHAGFASVGAFTGVVVAAMLEPSVSSDGLRLLISMLAGGVMAGIVSLLVGIPVLRLRGDYLAIVTLAFGEIIRNVVNCMYIGLDSNGLHMSMSGPQALEMAADGKMLINGPMGASQVSKISSFVWGFGLILFTLFVVLNLVNSRNGRAIMALRDNRIAAESVGINVTKYKLMAFITSAVLAGMAGVLFAMNFSTVVAKKFDFNTSILVLVFVVLGGMGNIRGSIIAAAVLTILPELLRDVDRYRMLVYSIVLILVMLARNNQQITDYLNTLKSKFSRNGSLKEGGETNV